MTCRKSVDAVAALVLALAVCLTLPTPASAKLLHEFQTSFNGSATPTGSFVPAGLSVDNSTSLSAGDIYLTDLAGKVIDRFSAVGAYQCQITGQGEASSSPSECDKSAPGVPGGLSEPVRGQSALDGSGNLFFPDYTSGKVDEFSPIGAFLSSPASPGSGAAALALDAAGDLYVADPLHAVVRKCEGASCSAFAYVEGVAGIAVDEDPSSPTFGDVYVANGKEELVDVFDPTGVLQRKLTPPATEPFVSVGGLAIDPSSGRLYVADPVGHAVFEFEPGGAFVSRLAVNGTNLSKPVAVAVNATSGDLYVADQRNYLVDVYRPRIVPDVTTGQATDLSSTGAALHGHLDPAGGGEVTSCRFLYGKTTSYGKSKACSPQPPYTAPTDVEAGLGGLAADTTYHYRLEAANASGLPSIGEDETFTTPGPPTVDYETTEALQTSATFMARIDPWGYDTTCQVQYVTEADFQQSQWANATTVPCSPEDLGSTFGDHSTKRFTVTGLARATTYHYRFLATNQAGASAGTGSTFETYGIRKLSFEFLNSSVATPDPGAGIIWGAGEAESPPQAGAHPYELVTTVTFSHTTEFSGEYEIVNNTAVNTKDIRVDLPPGLIGNPAALPKCNRYLVPIGECPSDTQVGVIEVWTDYPLGRSSVVWPLPEENENVGLQGRRYQVPIYNLEPSETAPAEFAGFIAGQAPAWIPFHLRTGGDYGVSADSINITDVGGGIMQVRTRVWGVPADPAHEVERQKMCPQGTEPPCPDTEPEVPLLINPTACTGPQTITASADSWQEPGVYVKKSAEVEGTTGCNQLHFKPTLEALPSTNVADSPSGLHVDLHVPQDLVPGQSYEDPHGKATSQLKDAKVTLPPGLLVNPASASGLEACSPAQIELHGPKAPSCPDAAKIGRIEVDTPLIDHPLPGAVYVATPHDNPFGSLLAIYAVVNDPQTGVIVKLAGKIEADPQTGQLTTSFDENPQLPFADFKLDFFAGPRAALRTAPLCGKYETESTLTPWAAPEVESVASASPFEITQAAKEGAACPTQASEEPNSPSFEAGTETPTAGAFSPFVLHLHREDGSQEIKGINTVLPPGLSAKLAGVAECPDAAIKAAEEKSGTEERESPSCPSGSEVGTVNVATGAGPAPYWTQGHAYLAGPYKNAPLSLAILTPATAGPYDLGDVVVRAALYVNPETAQVTVKSDPIPTILQGIPLDLKTINVKMARPNFTLNPTSCEPMAVRGEALSVLGQAAALSAPFQVGNCEALGFRPKLSLSLKGSAKRIGHPALRAVLTMPPGNANIARAAVALPHSEFLDNAHIRTICTRVQFAEGNVPGERCPPASIYGYARAWTPLLEHPLEGPVFLRASSHELPDLVAALNGQIQIALDGRIDSVNGGIRNSFEVVPDAPVSRFVLSMQGGRKGLLENSENLCARPHKASAIFDAQNGRVSETEPALKVRCPKKRKHHRKRHRAG